MQITCLDGEVWYEGDTPVGNFSIRVMVEIGERAQTERHVRVYTGCERSVRVQQVMSFCAGLRS